MKRLVTLIAAASIVLVLVSLTHHHRPVRHSVTSSTGHAVDSDARPVARTYVTALLAGDLSEAVANSTALLAKQLAAQPPQPLRSEVAPRLDLLALDHQTGWADLAAELRWPDGRVAALRVQLVLQNGRWLVAGVQP